ncbi:hypothetical protein AeNC1_013598 [Aphanomyces euteiches]|nr:hypothetical protein AeNC1_013598 [Aphanomyces euteiches]
MLYATDGRTICNAIIMARNIRNTGTPTSIPIVTLVSNAIPSDVVQHLRDAGIVAVEVNPWRQTNVKDSEWIESLMKLRIFEERGYDKVIYLDSDAWVHRNLDYLFHLGDAVLWAPHAYYLTDRFWFGSTLLVFSPSNALFSQIEKAIANPRMPNYYDMDVINDLWNLDCGYLPNHYVVLSYTLNADTKWSFASKAERIAKTYVAHFSPGIGLGKPWNNARNIFATRHGDEPLLKSLYESYWAAEDQLCSWLH